MGSHRDALGLVLLLLRLQGELYEQLLQLLIAIIYTELLKAAKKIRKIITVCTGGGTNNARMQ